MNGRAKSGANLEQSLSSWSYSRGFLLTRSERFHSGTGQPAIVPEYWVSGNLASWTYQLHTSTSYRVLQRSDSQFILLVGHFFDPWSGRSEAEVLQQLSTAFPWDGSLTPKSDSFWRELDRLTGRWRLFFVNGNEITAATDAMGLATLYFSGSGAASVLASHAPIIADYTGAPRDQEMDRLVSSRWFRVGRRHLPGRRTPFEGIHMLGANQYWESRSGRVRRFFPNGPDEEKFDWSKLVDETAEVLTNSARMLLDRFPAAVSLSLGTDSRLTLAAFNAVRKDIRAYSYRSNPQEARDAVGAAQLCQLVGVPHTTYDAQSTELDPALIETVSCIIEKNGGDSRRLTESELRKIALLCSSFPSDLVEVKSPVSEVGRATYSKRMGIGRFPQPLAPRDMSNLYKRIFWPRSLLHTTDRAFAEFIKETAFGSGESDYKDIDLFFWEHRHAHCEALGLLDHDIYHDTSVLFNNRRLIQNLLRPPFEDRLHDRLHLSLIKKLWPELLQVPTSSRGSLRAKGRIAAEHLFFRLNSDRPLRRF